MPATNAQVQQYVNERVRPRSEQIRNLYLSCKDDKATIDDVYANLTNNPTWTDTRSDAPPHLLTPSDVLAWNTFLTQFIALVEGTFPDVATANSAAAQYPIIQNSCVRQVRETL